MSYKGIHTDPEILDQKRQSEIAKTKFPKIFKEHVSMDKVNRSVIDKWVETEVNTLVPGDDILMEYIKNLIDSPTPDIKDIHLQLTSFLEDSTLGFTTKLWQLLLDAQKDPDGIPSELTKARENELVERQNQSKEANDAKKLTRKEYNDREPIKSHNKWENQSHRVSKVNRNRRNKREYRDTRAPSGDRILHDTYTPRR